MPASDLTRTPYSILLESDDGAGGDLNEEFAVAATDLLQSVFEREAAQYGPVASVSVGGRLGVRLTVEALDWISAVNAARDVTRRCLRSLGVDPILRVVSLDEEVSG